MAGADSKAARAAYLKAWREAHKEELKAYAAAYYVANKARMNAEAAARYRADSDSYKQRARDWKERNPERFKALRAKERAVNRDKIREISRRDWQKHNVKRRAAKAAHRARFPELAAHYCRLRQTRQQRATPSWANLEAIKAVYRRAAELSRQTGQKWHVDHEIPLKHPLVCGLHNEFNLRVIPATVNQSKGNRLLEGQVHDLQAGPVSQ